MKLLFDSLQSPIGTLFIVAREGKLVSLDFDGYEERMHRLLKPRYPEAIFENTKDPCGFTTRMQRYFEGDMGVLETFEVETGGTPFQQEVWMALREIPAGSTWSYAQLARRVGRPTGFRAVGAANGLNPVAIVLPCHRVIGSNNSLTGYGGGLHRKRWLLQHENALPEKLFED